MRVLFALLIATLLPALALAQTPVAAQQNSAQQNATPLWGTADGHILAMIAFHSSTGAPVLPQSPQISSAADWQLVDITNFINGGLSLRLNSNVGAYANFGRGIVLAPLNSAAVSLGCDSSFAFTLAALCPARNALSNRGEFHIGTDLNAGSFDFDLNYGIDWLRNNGTQTHVDGALPPQELFNSLGNPALPTLVIPNLQIAGMLNSGVGAEGRWHWDDTQSIDLGAALSRLQLELPGSPLAPVFNQAALSFGVRHGDFSGVIVGRMLGPADPLASTGVPWTWAFRGVRHGVACSVLARRICGLPARPRCSANPRTKWTRARPGCRTCNITRICSPQHRLCWRSAARAVSACLHR